MKSDKIGNQCKIGPNLSPTDPKNTYEYKVARYPLEIYGRWTYLFISPAPLPVAFQSLLLSPGSKLFTPVINQSTGKCKFLGLGRTYALGSDSTYVRWNSCLYS